MPVEIKELVIRTVVNGAESPGNDSDSGSGGAAGLDNDDVIHP